MMLSRLSDSHYVLCRKVLREPRGDALALGMHFAHVQLTHEKCRAIAIGWHDAGEEAVVA